jgi:hypothetical protein
VGHECPPATRLRRAPPAASKAACSGPIGWCSEAPSRCQPDRAQRVSSSARSPPASRPAHRPDRREVGRTPDPRPGIQRLRGRRGHWYTSD